METKYLILALLAVGVLYYFNQKSQSKPSQLILNAASETAIYDSFVHYTAKYGKNYGHDEKAYRFRIYKQNSDIISQHNLKYESGDSKFFLGHNEFSDMDLNEFKTKMLGTTPGPQTNLRPIIGNHFQIPSTGQLKEQLMQLRTKVNVDHAGHSQLLAVCFS